jgi:hypothetical protein
MIIDDIKKELNQRNIQIQLSVQMNLFKEHFLIHGNYYSALNYVVFHSVINFGKFKKPLK